MQVQSILMQHKTLQPFNFLFKGEKKCQQLTLQAEEKQQLPASTLVDGSGAITVNGKDYKEYFPTLAVTVYCYPEH